MNNNKLTKLEKTLVVVCLSLLFLLIVLAWQVLDLRSRNSTLTNSTDNIEKLINEKPGVLGRSCGILNKQVAIQILNTDELEIRFSNQPTVNVVNTQEGGIHWSDSCRFASVNNSNVYAEMFIETFQNSEDAALELKNDLPEVGTEKEALDNYDELYYSSGAWFARKGEVVIKVSANDGKTRDLYDFSKGIFESLTSSIE